MKLHRSFNYRLLLIYFFRDFLIVVSSSSRSSCPGHDIKRSPWGGGEVPPIIDFVVAVFVVFEVKRSWA